MGKFISWLDKKLYPKYKNNWDDILFREYILKTIKPESTILDLGAGAGIINHMNFRGLAKMVCGVDLDPRVVGNPYLDEGRIADASGIPYSDNEFDIVFSDNVLEHLEHPVTVFNEVCRVLKPGGIFLFKTPNKTHYMPLISRLTPHTFHQYINRLRGREVQDTFPTFYRANSKKNIVKLANKCGFSVLSIDLIEGRPEYMRIFWPLYIVGSTYEKLVNSVSLFENFRILLVGTLKKSEK